MKFLGKIFWVILLFSGLAHFSWAQKTQKENLDYLFLMKPLESKNQFPFYLPYLFMPFEQAKTLPENVAELKIGFYKASTFVDYYACNQRGVFDVETSTLAFQYARSFEGGWEARAFFPLIYYGPGYLDTVIENFHHAFKLPNGGRESAPSNRMLIEWQADNGKTVRKDQPLYGAGDPAIFVKKELWGQNPYLALSVALKFPLYTEEFVSSKTFDLGAALHFDYYGNYLYFYATAGCVYFLGEGDYSEELRRVRSYTAHAGIGFALRISGSVGLFNQFYAQTSPYEIGVKRIDAVSVVHSFGVRVQALKDFVLQVSADEDSFTYATSDIAFHFQGESRF